MDRLFLTRALIMSGAGFLRALLLGRLPVSSEAMRNVREIVESRSLGNGRFTVKPALLIPGGRIAV